MFCETSVRSWTVSEWYYKYSLGSGCSSSGWKRKHSWSMVLVKTMSAQDQLCFLIDSLIPAHSFTLTFIVRGLWYQADSYRWIMHELCGCKRCVKHSSCSGMLKQDKCFLTWCDPTPFQTCQTPHTHTHHESNIFGKVERFSLQLGFSIVIPMTINVLVINMF